MAAARRRTSAGINATKEFKTRVDLDSPSETPTSVVELAVSCRNLIDTDMFSKSDPICVLFMQGFRSLKWMEAGRTEMIKNSLNPDFAKKFVVPFHFEEIQKLKFELLDVDSSSKSLSDHDFMGFAEFTLGEIVSLRSCSKPLQLDEKKKSGKHSKSGKAGIIIVKAEELSSCKEEMSFEFIGHRIRKSSSIFGSSPGPFLTISKANESGNYTIVHRTEPADPKHPEWKTFTLSVQSLCNTDFERGVRIQCFRRSGNGNHKFVGEFDTNLNQLLQPEAIKSAFPLVNPKKQQRDKCYKNSGEIFLTSITRQPLHTFVDFIQGGTEILCTIAIDFTSSNGKPTNPNSLHYINPNAPNHYIQALRAVGEIIQDYDSDKLFPVLGFGAKVPPKQTVSHEFYINFHDSNPYCNGIDGVIEAYRNCLQSISFSGPTHFAPVINHVAKIARTHIDGTKYNILLILTNGAIADMPKTKDAIVHASNLPMSIIIVGIGDAEFDEMEELDADIIRLQSKGRFAERDIVQFVPFRNFADSLSGANSATVQARLAKAILAEVPDQCVSYMKKHGIRPAMRRNLLH